MQRSSADILLCSASKFITLSYLREKAAEMPFGSVDTRFRGHSLLPSVGDIIRVKAGCEQMC